MLTESIIRLSSSPWSFPVILVKKRDGKYRFCVDYRKVNNVIVKDVYPIHRIDEVMNNPQGSTYPPAIDLRSGYWKVEVKEINKEKTAFTTSHGLYEFNMMPFGLCNAPATFERNMLNMLGNLRWQICLFYLDDVIIYIPDFLTHLKRLEANFKCFRESNLRMSQKLSRRVTFAKVEKAQTNYLLDYYNPFPLPIFLSKELELTLLNMPRRSRPLIGRNMAASRRYRNAIAIETPLQSETRRALRRLRYSEARVAAAQTMQVPVQRIQLWTHKPFSGLQYNTHIDYKADSSVDIGQMSRVCQFCSALRFRDEPFGLCCKQGRVSLPAIETSKYAIQGLPSMLYQDIQVCYTRTTKYAIPGLPNMLYQECQVCYTRSIKYAIPGVPRMLYQEYQVCYTRSTKCAIPGEPRMFHKENQGCYTSSEDPIGPSSKPQPSKPRVRFELPKETRSGRRIKTPSRYNESIGRDFRHWKGSDVAAPIY
ncbi:K02A2.6-like [Cordylochernes scorpioides]|uniref:K02A2.6-like n=1 Tax=Cordylochernes scorpioides TaxID=51811 RepID=A0ABY6L952_9ARAC|nr:K02A2.6-like [Cordylochernes scorpioides]